VQQHALAHAPTTNQLDRDPTPQMAFDLSDEIRAQRDDFTHHVEHRLALDEVRRSL
jgi:hypothetical protein